MLGADESYVLAQAKQRVINGFAVRAMGANKGGMQAELALERIYDDIKNAELLAAEVVKALDAVPFIEEFLTAEMTHTACACPAEMVEPQMKLREGYAGVLRQLNDRRALVKYGADAIFDEVRANFPVTDVPNQPKGGK